MSTNDFSMGDVFRDGLEGGLSELLAGAMVGSAKLLWKWVSAPQANAAIANAEMLRLEEVVYADTAEVAFDWAAYAHSCGEDFLQCLVVGDHTRACSWCDPTLFSEPERKERLLNTLAYSRPTEWTHANSLTLRRSRTQQDAYGLDFDVFFNVDGQLEAYALLLVFVHYGDSLAVSDLYWEAPEAADWRQIA
jgi:hypothetical protein